MLQLILTYLIISAAIVYTAIQTLALFKTQKSACGGCASCEIRKELKKRKLTPIIKN